MTRKEQLVLDPSLAPPEIPEIRERVYAWLDAKDEARQASERVKLRHDVMIGKMGELGVERYPYVDSHTGKKKHVLADKTPRAKTIAAPVEKRPKTKHANVETTPREETVEVRRVSRESVEHEIRKPRKATTPDNDDPFAKTRSLLDEASEKQNPDTVTEH